jgi:translation initiation factor 5A
MADITLKNAGSLQKGNYVIVEGVASVVASVTMSKPGKHGSSKCRLEAIGIIDGKKRQVVVPGHDSMECPIIGKKNAQVLSISGNTANVMDMETYETYDLIIPDELQGKVTDGDVVLYWQILNDKVMKQVMQKGQ